MAYASFKLLGSGNHPVSASQVTRNTGSCYCTQHLPVMRQSSFLTQSQELQSLSEDVVHVTYQLHKDEWPEPVYGGT